MTTIKDIFNIQLPKAKGLISYGLKIVDDLYDFNEAYYVKNSYSAFEAISLFLENTSFKVNEHAGIITLNSANRVVGYFLLSTGGVASTIMDVNVINIANVLTLSKNCILYHTHPSGNPIPSQADDTMTQKICKSLNTINVKVLDHLIITPNNDKTKYYSYLESSNNNLTNYL